MNLLNNVKSKFCLENIFDYMPYSTCLKITKGSRALMQKLQITNETFKEINEFKKITKPSYHIKKYFSYFGIVPNDTNEENYLKEKILCMGLNISQHNISLFIGDEEWEYIIKNFYNINLEITPNLLYYINNLKIENKNKVYQLLNLYKNHITQITISYFNNKEWSLKIEIINQIIDFLTKVFEQNKKDKKDDNKNNINSIIDAYNENSKVKKICFEFNVIPAYIDIITKVFQKIDNILPFQKIEELIFDTSSFRDFRFTDVMKFITNKMTVLKLLKINNSTFSRSNYADLNVLFSNLNETIEILDLSSSVCTSDIISVLNNKKNPLKEVKLNLYSNNNKIEWLFLEKNINSLEVFQMEIQENNNNYNINQIILILNKMKKLKYLKLLGCLNVFQLNKFNENENLEYLNIDLFFVESFKDELMITNLDEIMTYFLKNFKNLKSLIIKTFEILDIQHLKKFLLPTNLTCLELINFRGDCLKSLLNNNKENLGHIEEFKIESSIFLDYFDFIQLFEIFKVKNFKKLSINKILFDNYYDALFYKEKISSFLKNNVLYEKISSFLKNSHSLVELDISNNNHIPLFLKKQFFEIIKSSITKKLLSIKIFSNDSILYQNEFNFFKNLFGFMLD